jgi:hypothetical protein
VAIRPQQRALPIVGGRTAKANGSAPSPPTDYRRIHVSTFDRQGRDFYATPDWVTEALLQRFPVSWPYLGALLWRWSDVHRSGRARLQSGLDGHRRLWVQYPRCRFPVSVARPPHCLAQAEYDPLAGGCRTAGQPGLLHARCQLRGKLNVWRRIERRRYVVSWVSAAWGAFHFHGSSVSSSCRLVRPDTMRLSTSVSQANGSTSLSFAD